MRHAASLFAALVLTAPWSAFAQEPAGTDPAKGRAAKPSEEVMAPNDAAWHPRLKAIAAGYAKWGRIDDEARFAPELCRAPRMPSARFSEAAPATPHGAKLYTLYVKDPLSYAGKKDPFKREVEGVEDCLQVVVKEAWAPEAIASGRPGDAQKPVESEAGPSGLKPAEKDGVHYRAARRSGLFVMFKLDPKTPSTDEGWVYGTIGDDLKTISGSGRIASCMKCHEKAPKDRLFGVKENG